MAYQSVEIPDGDIPILLALVNDRLQQIPGHPINAYTRLQAQLLRRPQHAAEPQAWRVWMDGKREVRPMPRGQAGA